MLLGNLGKGSKGEIRNAAGNPGGGMGNVAWKSRRGKKCCLENPRQGEILLCSNRISRKGVQF